MAAKKLTIENVKIYWANFSGKERENNPAGKRNFGVFIDPDMVEDLRADGWNVKQRRPSNDNPDQDTLYYLAIQVSFNKTPPKIFAVGDGRKRLIDESEVSILDYEDLQKVDVTIQQSIWHKNGRSGITAYLNKMYAVIGEDYLDKKYNNYQDVSVKPDDESLPF